MRLSILTVFFCLYPSFYYASVYAETGSEKATELTPLDIIAPSESSSSSAVTYIDSEMIRDRPPQVISDLLQGQTGLFVQQTTPGQGLPLIRGLKGSEVLHMVDGIRLNNALFRNAPNQYFSLIDPYNVDQIEVVRGTASIYGNDAMGGVVKVSTPVPRFYSETWQTEHQLRGKFASADNSVTTRIETKGGKQGIGISGGLTYQNVDDRRAGGGEIQEPSAFSSWAGNATLFLEPDDRQELRIDLQYLRQPKTPRFDELVSGFGQTEPGSAIFNFEPNDRLFLHASYQLDSPVSMVDWFKVDLAYQQINDDRRSRNFGSTEEKREENRSSLTGLTMQAHTTWSDHSWLTYGVELYWDRVSSRRSSTNIETGFKQEVNSRFPDGSTMDSLAFYLQNEIKLLPELKLELVGRYSMNDIHLSESERGMGVDLDVDDFSGDISLRYDVIPEVSLISHIGSAFRPPNIFDLGTLGPRPGNRFNVANPGLKAERLLMIDMGIETQVGGFHGELFGFYSNYYDKITSVETGQITDDGRTIIQSRNRSRLDLWGVELGFHYYHQRYDLELFGSLNFTRGEEQITDGNTQPADRIPPLNGRLGLRYYPKADFWIEPEIRFASRQGKLSQRDINDPRINPEGSPGWITTNLRMGWEAHSSWTVYFALENLTDTNYRQHASGIDAPGINAILSFEGRF